MLILITKASSDYWYDFIEEDSIENLIGRFTFSGHLPHNLIIKENFYYRAYSYDICKAFNLPFSLASLEQAFKIAECRYEIQIYDDYVE